MYEKCMALYSIVFELLIEIFFRKESRFLSDYLIEKILAIASILSMSSNFGFIENFEKILLSLYDKKIRRFYYNIFQCFIRIFRK